MDAGGVREIHLSTGHVAIVDAADYERIAAYPWRAAPQMLDPSVVYVKCQRQVARVRRSIALHRVIMDAPSGALVDHINGNPLDNRRCNLRICTRAQNNRNRRANAGRLKGVRRAHGTKKWEAGITADDKAHHLGTFLTELDAARAYDEAAIRLHGEFARLNFPDEHPRLVQGERQDHKNTSKRCGGALLQAVHVAPKAEFSVLHSQPLGAGAMRHADPDARLSDGMGG